MVKLRGSTTSLDHTFKVSSNVGFFHLNKWSVQYDSLVLVLNESGHVLARQLTRCTSFKQVYTLLKKVYYRDTEKTKEIYIDSCCLWSEKVAAYIRYKRLHSVGSFHAIKRFTKELSKYSTSKVFRKQCKEDFRLLFRENSDFGKDRLKATRTKEKMMEKLKYFSETWLGVAYNSKPFICKDAIKALDNLGINILEGYLENIPPKTGTSRNESLHRRLNNIISITKCSVELIVSILVSFFYEWNADHSIRTIPLVPKYEKKEKYFEAFGIGISVTEITDIKENDKLPITNENSTSTSILDQINAGLEQLNV